MKEGNPDYSDDQAFRIAYLIAGYIRKTLTVEEHDELDAWVEASDENMRLFEELTDEKNIEANLAWMERLQTEKALQHTKAHLIFKPEKPAARSRSWWPYIAAASVIIIIAAIIFLRSAVSATHDIARNTDSTREVLPGGNKATLILSDGSAIDLTRASNGVIKNDDGATIEKKEEGQIMYAPSNPVQEASYNTLLVPKGGQYGLTLADGTKVMLNAQSSLKYPVQFAGKERVVELSGEGYFEVAKDSAHPFIVRLSPNEEVKVLGTEFNVMGYDNEPDKKITLVEGHVQVRSTAGVLQLKPGQQAVMQKAALSLNTGFDMNEATGWKKGEFVFRNAEIYTLMRQVERWYDVDVIFKTITSEHFNATISRNEPVSKLLQLLELTGKIHFKIENKIIYVLP